MSMQRGSYCVAYHCFCYYYSNYYRTFCSCRNDYLEVKVTVFFLKETKIMTKEESNKIIREFFETVHAVYFKDYQEQVRSLTKKNR